MFYLYLFFRMRKASDVAQVSRHMQHFPIQADASKLETPRSKDFFLIRYGDLLG